MKKFLKNNIWIIGIIVFMIIFPIVILVPSKIGFIPRDIGIAILGYVGTILGGFLTLYGVWRTIEDNNKSKQKELELQYAPILSAEIVSIPKTTPHLSDEIILLFDDSCFKDKLIYSTDLIELCNVGRGEIQNYKIEIVDVETITIKSNKELNINTENSYILPLGSQEFVPINGKVYLYVAVPESKMELDSFYIRLGVTLRIEIEGAFSSNKESYQLALYLDYTKDERFNIDSFKLIRDKK